jgi:hypothetical protein
MKSYGEEVDEAMVLKNVSMKLALWMESVPADEYASGVPGGVSAKVLVAIARRTPYLEVVTDSGRKTHLRAAGALADIRNHVQQIHLDAKEKAEKVTQEGRSRAHGLVYQTLPTILKYSLPRAEE